MDNSEYINDEISLFEILIILKKHLKFIAIFVIIIMTFALSYVLLLQNPLYEADALLIASTDANDFQPIGTNEVSAVLAAQQFAAQYKIDSIIQQIKLQPVMTEVIEHLDLFNRYGITSDILKSMLNITTTDKLSLIKISVKHKDPVLAKEIVNTTIDCFIHYFRNLSNSKLDTRINFLTQETIKAKKVYEQNLIEFQNFQLQEYPIEEIRSDYNQAKNAVAYYKENLEQINYSYETKIDKSKTINNLLKNTSPLIVLKKSVKQDPIIFNQLTNSRLTQAEIQQLTSQEEIPNPVYEKLLNNSYELTIELSDLEKQIDVTKSRITTFEEESRQLLTMLHIKEKIFTDYQNKLEASKMNLLAFQETLNTATIQRGSDTAEQRLTIASYAVIPQKDISNGKMILAIALLLALFLSILFVFLFEAYENFKIKEKVYLQNQNIGVFNSLSAKKDLEERILKKLSIVPNDEE